MLTSISPVGEHGRGQRWWLTVTAYVLGSVIGGAVTGGIAGGIGALTLGWLGDSGALVALLVVAVAAAAVEPATSRLPMWRRQVDEDWLTRYRGWVYGVGFGAQLGAAFTTFVSSTLVHLTFAAALLTRSPVAGAAVGAVFGLVRALPVTAMHRVDSPGALAAVHRRLQQARVPAARLTRASTTVTAVIVAIGVAL